MSLMHVLKALAGSWRGFYMLCRGLVWFSGFNGLKSHLKAHSYITI